MHYFSPRSSEYHVHQPQSCSKRNKFVSNSPCLSSRFKHLKTMYRPRCLLRHLLLFHEQTATTRRKNLFYHYILHYLHKYLLSTLLRHQLQQRSSKLLTTMHQCHFWHFLSIMFGRILKHNCVRRASFTIKGPHLTHFIIRAWTGHFSNTYCPGYTFAPTFCSVCRFHLLFYMAPSGCEIRSARP